MADNMLTMSRPGQVNKAGDIDASFLKIFSGEVLTAFEETNVMKDLHRMRTIDHGKAASFPVLGKANARYHVPGTPILGSNQIAAAERTINIDDLLIADVAIYDLEDAMNHYDVRGEYSRQLGRALAKEFDLKTMRVVILAARSAGIIDDEPGGTVLKNPAFATDGKELAKGIFNCAQVWDEKDIVDDERSVIVKPAQYYLMAQTLDLLNHDWGGSGVYKDGTIYKVGGVSIIKSNHMPTTNITANKPGEKNDYFGDFTNTVAVALQKDAIGTVKLRDLSVQQSGHDFNVMYQSTLMVGKYAMGHGILRPGCAIELSKAAA